MKHYIELDSGTPNARILETTVPHMWPNAKRLSAKAGKARLKAEAIKYLQGMLKPGDTVYCILRNVSRSGMSRQIDFLVAKSDAGCKPHHISHWIARALDYPQADGGALKVGGCGMDMGFEVVYNLGRALWPNGTPKPHGRRNGEPDSDGGYALKHSWL